MKYNDERRFCVYLYQRKDDGIVYYIGQGTKNRPYVMNKHNQLCQDIDNKHGTNIIIYKDNLTKQEALDLEKALIKEYMDNGYGLSISGYYKKDGLNLANATFGGEDSLIGELNPAKRKDVREKISQHAKEHNSFALEEVRAKDSKRMKEFSNTPEQKEIQSQRMKTYYQTEEGQKRKAKQAEINKKYFAEHREEHIQKLKDYFKTEKGKEQARKQSERCKGQIPNNAQGVMCVETQETYSSMKILSLKLGKNKGYIKWQFEHKLKEDNTIEIQIEDKVYHYKKI